VAPPVDNPPAGCIENCDQVTPPADPSCIENCDQVTPPADPSCIEDCDPVAPPVDNPPAGCIENCDPVAPPVDPSCIEDCDPVAPPVDNPPAGCIENCGQVTRPVDNPPASQTPTVEEAASVAAPVADALGGDQVDPSQPSSGDVAGVVAALSGMGPALTLPPTDVVGGPVVPSSSNESWRLVLLGLAALIASLLLVPDRTAHRRS
jgi:hypothetical protein